MSAPAPRWTSDAIVDLLIDAGIEYVAFNPGASFRGLHDSLVHHREDGPQIVLCTHEAISVAIAHGYSKAAGKPMAALLHNVVGLQNASMAIYNAWCDRVPLVLIGGTGPMPTPERRPWIDWIHTANVQGQQIRDYVKWDDQPADAASIPRALVRALRFAQTAPPGPTYVCLDAGVQEQAHEGPDWPSVGSFPLPTPPSAPAEELDQLAERLRTARLPLLVTDYAGDTRGGYEALLALAELLHAPVLDRGARMNFPVDHALNVAELPEVLDEADLVLAFEVEDLFGALRTRAGDPDLAVVHVAAGHLRVRSWAHDVGELTQAAAVVTATADTALPALLARLRAVPPSAEILASRREALGDRASLARAKLIDNARHAESPSSVHPARLAIEAWDVLADEDPIVVHSKTTDWERRVWPLSGYGSHLGWHGGGGLGHGLGASIGAALALGNGDRLLVDLQPDGDLLFTPSALWTAARMRSPLLILVQNNRQYRNTVEHAVNIAAVRGRAGEDRYAGAGLSDPNVDFTGLARSFGVWAQDPVSSPDGVGPALRAAVQVVRNGRPALVEVITSGA